MGAALGAIAGIGLLGLAFVVDLAVGEIIRWGASSFRSAEALAVVTVIRVGIAALAVGLAWIVFAGPRSRLSGLVMALAGGYVALIPALLWLNVDQVSRLLFARAHATGISAFVWVGAIVAILGVVELVRPTPPHAGERGGEAPAGADLGTSGPAA